MEIKVMRLKAVMDLLKPAINKKATLKATTFVCLHNGHAIATNLESMIIANVPEATESMLLPYSEIAGVLSYIPCNDTLKIEQKDKVIHLTWSDGSSSYPTEDFEDFPVLPELATKAEGLIDGDALLKAIKATLPYAATDEAMPVLHGVTVVLGSPVEVAAGDGFRASHQVLNISFPNYEGKIIIPLHAVSVMEHVFDKTPRTPPDDADSLIQVVTAKRMLHMSIIGENKLRLDFGTSASLVINLTDGNPPDFIALLPKGEPILQTQLFAPQFEAAIKRVKEIAKGGSGITRLEFADGKVKISAKSEDREISTKIDAILTQGEPGRVAINYVYLLDYLNKKSGIITMSQFTEQGPVQFEYQQYPKVLIMPMFVNWETGEAIDTKKKEEPAAEEEGVAEGKRKKRPLMKLRLNPLRKWKRVRKNKKCR